ncbi:MAG: molybdopterin-dependent oxidoreductase, partial [Chloroflexi bacterium]|nr:molybdopterin-dependent oxidoreductase [Chloroflexota bacterium]
ALEPGAPLLHEELGSNVACHRRLRYGDPDQVFAQAEVVIRRRFRYPKYGSTPMEGYGVVAAYDPLGESYTIWSNFQGPFTMHPVAARALRTPEHRVRFIVPQDSGGAFGIKTSMFPYIALIALAARKAEVAVKWIEDRQEHLLASSSGTDRVAEVELAANRDGTILGLRARLYDNVGGYIRAPEPGCLFRPLGNYVGPYRFQHLDFDCYAVMTNKSLTGPNRGYGCGHLYFQTERLVDLLAEELGLDPAEVRRRNFIPPDAFPYTTPTGGIYDSGNYPAALERALELAGYDQLRREQQAARAQGRLFGLGLAATVDPSVSNMGYVTIAYPPETRARPGYLPKAGAAETGLVTVDSLGNVTAVVNTVPEGQGHETVVAQIVADRLGLDPKDVRVVTDFDTASRVWSITTGTYSSRFAAAGASAAALAAERVRDKMVRIAAHLLEVAPEDIELGNARFTVRGATERSLSFRRIAGTAHWQPSALPAGMEVGLNASCVWDFALARPPDEHDRVNSSQTYGFSIEIAAVEVDPRTGELEIKKLVSVHDAGRILNPLIVEGQVYGAIAHGLGGALLEELAYSEDGQFLSATLMDYLWPTARDVPNVVIDHLETPSPFSLLGSKGIGESSTMSIPPLLANAVSDALKPLGVEVTELPLSPNRVWSLLQQARPSAPGAPQP